LEAKADLSGWRARKRPPVGTSGVVRLAERYRFHKYCGAISTGKMAIGRAILKGFQLDNDARDG
jgi:hypothetical protein